MSKKILIVGGVAGGASAAARMRRLDETAQIIMFERDNYISFANCGLPYYIGETIQERSKLLVQTPEAMYRRFRIDVRVNSEVIAVMPDEKKVRVRSGEEIYEETYDSLILSPGAKALKPPLNGIENAKIMTLRNIPDTDRIKKYVDHEQPKTAIVIGGGYVGIEMVESLVERGIKVSLVENNPQILTPVDPEIAIIAAKELQDHGVNQHMSNGVQGFEDLGKEVGVILADGTKLAAELVILAIGVRPDTEFLKDSGLAFGPRGHLIVDANMKTNKQDVYAVGDAVEVVDYMSGKKTAIPLAGPANKQGRIAADNIAGLTSTYKGTQGTSIIKVFNLTVAGTGHNEKQLKAAGVDYHTITVHPGSHAGYYPGAAPITLKLLFAPDGKVLGAQGVGADGVDKRIDSIATVIRFGGSVYDLTELELAYAPPYSSAKDPVNFAGYVAENVLTDKTKVFTLDKIAERDEAATMFIDVRSPMEHAKGHIPNSINIPVDDMRERLAEIDKSKEIWVYCQVGLRGYLASRILKQNGYNVKNLTGGYKSYEMASFVPTPQN
jgi:NADPH-dependent 2,4-dienoyl-CoA reductase/sulfur reductase-like enzyme/rhodanese-related sulfurtransferase